MWIYDKKLQYPVHIQNRDLRMAKNIITQFGGPNGELGATLRYLTQRYTMPDDKGKALLTDIGTEEYVQISYTYIYTQNITCKNLLIMYKNSLIYIH